MITLTNYTDAQLAEMAGIGSKACIAMANAVLVEEFADSLPVSVARSMPDAIAQFVWDARRDEAVKVLADAVRNPVNIKHEALRLDVIQEVLLFEHAEAHL